MIGVNIIKKNISPYTVLMVQNYECKHFPQSWGSHVVNRQKLDYWDKISSDLERNQCFLNKLVYHVSTKSGKNNHVS